MSSLAALLHDDAPKTIIVSGSKPLLGKAKSWHNEQTSGCASAEAHARRIARHGRNAYIKHAVHDGTLNDKRRPLCTATHFLGSRSFFLDVDVGHGDGYATENLAVAALRKAMQELYRIGLPRPNLYQSTGGGLQVAWVVRELVDPNEWRRLNGILFLVVTRTGLKVDRGVLSIDKAIRCCGPEFFNVNHGYPKPTFVLHFNEERVDNAIFVNALSEAGRLRPVPNDGITPSVIRPNGSGFNQRFAIKGQDDFALDVNVILDECKVLAEAIETEGLDHSRDHWLNLVSLLAKNGDEEVGRDIAHLISEKHPTHDAAETDKQFDYFRETAKGYTKCETFERSHPGLCQLCRHYRKFTSPAGIQGMLARTSEAEVTASNPGSKILDGEYFNSPAGVRRKKRGEEENHPIIWPRTAVSNLELKVLDTDRRRDILSFNVHSGNGWSTFVELTPQQLTNSSRAATALGEQHVALPERHHKMVQEAMVSWIQQLRQQSDRGTKYSRLGWTVDNRGFVLGTTVYHQDGSKEPIAVVDQELIAFNTRGRLDDYQDAASSLFAHEQRPEAHAFVAASLGAPLLELVGGTGMALNFCSARSGYGKTTLSQLAGSMWGSPRAMTFTLDDTENSIMRRVAMLNNLPGLYDEIRPDEHTSGRVLNMVFRLNSNVEKSRLTANSKLQDRGNWRTLMLFSTNYTFLDLMRADKRRGGDAAVARAMDFFLPPLPLGSVKQAAKISMETAKLETICNGWVGHTWAAYMATHQAAIRQTIMTLFDGLMRMAAGKNTSETFARNHCFAGATMIAAAHHAATVGIIPIDRTLVLEAVRSALTNAGEARSQTLKDHDPIIALRDFLRAHEAHRALVIRSGSSTLAVDSERYHVRLPFLFEVNTVEKMIYVDLNAFETWLIKTGLPKRVIMNELLAFRMMQPRSLAAGTKDAGAAIDVLAIKPEGEFAIIHSI